MSELSKLWASMEKAGEQRRFELEQFNEGIRAPDNVITCAEEPSIQYALWRVPEGVWKMRKYKNGYHPNEAVLIDMDELQILHELFERAGNDLGKEGGE